MTIRAGRAATFWTLAVICGLLRYVLDAHWPSDIIGGIVTGYVIASATTMYFKL